MNTTHDGGNQQPSEVRGDPDAPRTSSDDTRDQEIAELHDIIAKLWSAVDPDVQPELMALVHGVLGVDDPDGNCGNRICHELMKSNKRADLAEADRDHAREERDTAIAHGKALDKWISRAVNAAAPFQDDPELTKLLLLGDSTVCDGLRLGIAAIRDLKVAREELATLKALIPKWRATGAQIDTYHATMGTGYKACADEIEKALR